MYFFLFLNSACGLTYTKRSLTFARRITSHRSPQFRHDSLVATVHEHCPVWMDVCFLINLCSEPSWLRDQESDSRVNWGFFFFQMLLIAPAPRECYGNQNPEKRLKDVAQLWQKHLQEVLTRWEGRKGNRSEVLREKKSKIEKCKEVLLLWEKIINTCQPNEKTWWINQNEDTEIESLIQKCLRSSTKIR